MGAQAPVDRDGRDDATPAATCPVPGGGTRQEGAAPRPSARRRALTPRRLWPSPASRATPFWTRVRPADDIGAAPRTGPDGAHPRHAARAERNARRVLPHRSRRTALCILAGRPLRRRRGLEPRLFDRTGHERRRARAALALRRRLRVKRGRPHTLGIGRLLQGTTLTSMSSIASVAAGDRMRQLRCEAALKARSWLLLSPQEDAAVYLHCTSGSFG